MNTISPTIPAAPPAIPASGPVTLSVHALTKTYGTGATEVHAVNAVDLDVHAGEVLLVMGPSGSGKTTLLLMLGALLRPTSGSIVVADRNGGSIDIATAPERALPKLRAHSFGFIFQDYALLDALSATENIAVAANIAGLTGAAAYTRAAELLERVGLTHRASARPSQLSGGEQQRVSLARALANDPPILLADEPTANLDASRGRDLARLLRTLADEDHRSVVIVSHDERLREVADRVLWLEDGEFREVAAMSVDPVCGMSVEPDGPGLEWQGRVLWFCSDGCRGEFTDDPSRFTAPDPTTNARGVSTIPPGGTFDA